MTCCTVTASKVAAGINTFSLIPLISFTFLRPACHVSLYGVHLAANWNDSIDNVYTQNALCKSIYLFMLKMESQALRKIFKQI